LRLFKNQSFIIRLWLFRAFFLISINYFPFKNFSKYSIFFREGGEADEISETVKKWKENNELQLP